jgi:transcriptional regulator with XRE-family HTH domain
MRTTGELFNELKKDIDIENFIAANQPEFTKPLHKYLCELLETKNLTRKEIAFAMNVDPSYIHHIFSGKKKPSRERLLAIARAMDLNLKDTQYLLRYGGYGSLYPRNPFDSVIIYSIENGLTFNEMNNYLKQLGELPIVTEE